MNVEELIGALYLQKNKGPATLLREAAQSGFVIGNGSQRSAVTVCRLNGLLKSHGLKLKRKTMYSLEEI